MQQYHIHLFLPTEERLINIKSRSPGLRFFLLLNLPNNIASGILNFISAYSSGGCIGFPPTSLLLRTNSDTFKVTILFSNSIKHELVNFSKVKLLSDNPQKIRLAPNAYRARTKHKKKLTTWR
jgi:hypothetical protein